MVVNQSSYLFLRNNTYYFSRRIPLDMKSLYGSKRIVKSLKTRSKRVALRGSTQISFQLETYWSSIRVEQITQGLVSAPVTKVNSSLSGCGYDLLDAIDNYLKLKGEGKDHAFERTVDRNVNYFIEAVGNRELSDYTFTDGAKFRDFLLGKGLAVSSIRRIFSSLGPIIKLMIQEHGLSAISPLVGTYKPLSRKKDKRQPIPIPTIKRIQSVCMDINDDLRWVSALVSDTGMRLAEVCGLERNDVVLDAPKPHITLQPNSAISRGILVGSYSGF